MIRQDLDARAKLDGCDATIVYMKSTGKASGEHIADADTGEAGSPLVRIYLYREHLRVIQNAGYDLQSATTAINVRLKWHGNGRLRIDGAYNADGDLIEILSKPMHHARIEKIYSANTRATASAGAGRRLR